MKQISKLLVMVALILSCNCFEAYEDPARTCRKNTAQEKPPNLLAKRGGGFFVSADYLFWSAYEDGLEYAREVDVVSTHGGGFIPSSSSLSKTFSVNGTWSSGARAGIGYLFGNMDRWDLYLNWTYFYSKSDHSHGHFSDAFDPNRYYAPIWHPFLGARTSAAAEHWWLHYNTIDLQLGRQCFATKKFSVRPFAGLKAAWINQDIHANYMGVWPLVSGFAQLPTRFKADNDFKGIGLMAGSDLHWHFASQWSVLGQISAALLYGKFDVGQTIQGYQQTSENGTPLSYSNFKEKEMNRIRANLQTFLGLEWHAFFKNNEYALNFSAGYEFMEWFQQNETSQTLISIIGDGSGSTFVSEVREDGNLGLQGLTMKGQFDF
ncbi:MAG: Lpg1974 family pore-forming outer membrane protein [Chlamydiales bacterium]